MTGAAWLLIELAVLFLGISFLIQLFQRRFGAERLRTWMGGSPLTSALKGIAIGFVTPFCTYSAIPMLVGLRQAGVPPAGYVAFIAAAPVLDPVLFGALVVIVGLEAAMLYTAVAFAGTLTLALVAQRAGIDRHLKPLPA
ncbi:MAG: permease, partial [Actinomycetota bacterium]